jgi:hypothetical protein
MRIVTMMACKWGWVFACASAVAATPQRIHSSELLACSGLPCADFQAAGTSIKLLIDTGNAHSVLDLDRAKALGLTLAPYQSKSGQLVPGYQVGTLKDLRLGSESLGDVQVLVTDLKADIDKGVYPRADGSLSYRDLKDRVMTLDFRAHSIGLASASNAVDCGTPCGTLSYPTFGNKGPPIVASTGFAIHGVAITMQVDTLYSGTMLIYPSSVAKVGLADQSLSKRLRTFPYTDGGVEMAEGSVDHEDFGDRQLLRSAPVYFATPNVHLPDGLFDGTVGVGLLKDRVVTFDFHANRLQIG